MEEACVEHAYEVFDECESVEGDDCADGNEERAEREDEGEGEGEDCRGLQRIIEMK